MMKLFLLSLSVLALASCSALVPYSEEAADKQTWVPIVGLP